MLKTENKKGVFGQVLTYFCFVMEITIRLSLEWTIDSTVTVFFFFS